MVWKPKIPSTSSPTSSAPGSSSAHLFPENVAKRLTFLDQEPPFTPTSFQEPKLQEQSLEFVFFFSVPENISTIVSQPEPILTLPPFHTSFTFQASSTYDGTQGSVSSGVNMATSAFLLNRYAPIQLPQQLNPMPQE